MSKFILLYNGPATPQSEISEDEGKAIMQRWGAWIEKVGDAMVDVGQPMANGASVVDDGSEGKALELNGYSIVKADDIDGAKALVEGHPFLSDKSGKFSVEIFELMPMPGM